MFGTVTFPDFSGVRCLMMPYVQGDPDSIPDCYAAYRDIVATMSLELGATGFLTIDESPVRQGTPHRGARAKFGRALHTEAGLRPHSGQYVWGGGGWGNSPLVTLDADVEILLANNLDGSCAYWERTHPTTATSAIGLTCTPTRMPLSCRPVMFTALASSRRTKAWQSPTITIVSSSGSSAVEFTDASRISPSILFSTEEAPPRTRVSSTKEGTKEVPEAIESTLLTPSGKEDLNIRCSYIAAIFATGD